MASSTRKYDLLNRVGRSRLAAILAGLVAFAPAATARAQTPASAQAEMLFVEGKKLLDEKKFDQACPKLEASQRLDPATGTLLALAYCHEQQGRTASAWVEYRDAAGRAKAEGRMDRYQAAIDRAAALEGKLSRVQVDVPPEVAGLPGLEVKRDGVPIEREAWGSALPVDPGDHEMQVTAPGRKPWSMKIVVGPDGDKQVVTVPALEAEAGEAAPAGPVEEPGHPAANDGGAVGADTGVQGSGSSKTIAYVLGGVGLVGIGVGSYFGLQAASKNSDSKDHCDGNRCLPEGTTLRNDALDSAKYSTIAFAVGGALVAGGVLLYLTSNDGPSDSASIRTYPIVGPNGAGWAAGGTF